MFTPTPTTQQTDTSFMLNLERGCVRRIHYDLFPQRQFRSLMAAWSEELFTIVSRVPAGMRGPQAHWHDFDQIFYCLSGQLELQVGAERYTLTPGRLVAIPAGTPHEHRNEGTSEEIHLELIVPGIVPGRPILHPVSELPADWTGSGVANQITGPAPLAGNPGVQAVWIQAAGPSAEAPWVCAELILQAGAELPEAKAPVVLLVLEGTVEVDGERAASRDDLVILPSASRRPARASDGQPARVFVMWPALDPQASWRPKTAP
jgi:mannose-6-phosphate isomerase-like protein (cupin superfamily)